MGYPYYLYGVIDNRVMLQGAGLTDEEKSALEQEMLHASSGPAVVKGYTLVYQNEAMNVGQLAIGSSRYAFDASAEPIGLEDPLELNVRTADGFARKFFFERFTPVRLSSGNRSDELFLSESNGGVSPDTRISIWLPTSVVWFRTVLLSIGNVIRRWSMPIMCRWLLNNMKD